MRLGPSILLFAAALVLTSCDGGSDTDVDDDGCDIPCQWSTATSGGLCQANLWCDNDEPAVYCGELGDGTFDCACGAAVDDPPEFISDDFCDLEDEARVCQAIEQCTNWTFN
jgi:hypothetical protein